MLDIDIAEQLFPNIGTIVTQLCATAVLFYFLRKFLWEPTRTWIEKRQNFIQSEVERAKQNTISAEKELIVAKSKVKDAVTSSKEIISQAEQDANKRKENILMQADKEANRKIEKAKDQIEQEKLNMKSEMVEEMVNVALAATEKLISRKVDVVSDQQEIENFVKEIRS
jgi:F-type H+-transporting ATPase subunit b